jgi:Kef-type K+ transport system membrane component KefB
LIQLAVYIPVVLIGLSAAARYLMRRHPSDDAQFLVMLLIVILAAVGAEAINLEGIIGAFLAGIALNRAAEHTVAKERLEFIGNTLFVPLFFITVGFLIDVRVFAGTIIGNIAFVAAIVGGLIGAKLLAARIVQQACGYSRNERYMM